MKRFSFFGAFFGGFAACVAYKTTDIALSTHNIAFKLNPRYKRDYCLEFKGLHLISKDAPYTSYGLRTWLSEHKNGLIDKDSSKYLDLSDLDKGQSGNYDKVITPGVFVIGGIFGKTGLYFSVPLFLISVAYMTVVEIYGSYVDNKCLGLDQNDQEYL